MVSPEITTIIMLSFAVLLIIIIPLLDGSSKFGKYVSLRYTLTATAVVMAIACCLDLSHLAEHSRNIVLLGAFILIALFVTARSIEKIKLGGKSIELEAHKGDIGASLKVNSDKENKP